MLCDFKENKTGDIVCKNCGRSLPADSVLPIFRECESKIVSTTVVVAANTGNFLHSIVHNMTGEDFLPGCGCRDMMSKMADWGPDGCREHLEEIVDKMQSEGKKRGWKNKLLASMPILSRAAMKAMVLYAIRKAEKEMTDDDKPAKKDTTMAVAGNVAGTKKPPNKFRTTINEA